MAKVAVLGTGIMGAPIARNLARGGYAVSAWNRTCSKAEVLVADGVRVGESPADAAEAAGVVITMLADGPAVEAIAPQALSRGIVWVQSSTVGVAATESLGRLAAEAGALFVDAPASGRSRPPRR